MTKKISYIIQILFLFQLLQNMEILEKKFEKYIKKYNKKYESIEKKADHFKIFKNNYNLINAPNTVRSGLLDEKEKKTIQSKKEKLYDSEINFFGDITDEEFNKYYLLPEKTIYSIPLTSIPIKIKKKNKFIIMEKPVQSGILDYDKIPVLLEDSEITVKGFFENIFGKIKNFLGLGKKNKNSNEGVLKEKKEDKTKYFYEEKKKEEDENIEEELFLNKEDLRKKEEEFKNQEELRKQEIFKNQDILRRQNEKIIRQQILRQKKKEQEILRQRRIIEKKNAEILKKRKRDKLIYLKKKQFYDQNPFLRKIQQKVDWKERGFISPVRNQQKCNACYAFATIDAIQAYYAIYKNKIVNLSAQEIIDCSKKNFECFGGQPFEALNYVIKNNLSFEKDYKFIGKKGICAFNVNNNVLHREGRFLQDFNFGKDTFSDFNNNFTTLNNDFNIFKPTTNNFSSFKTKTKNYTTFKPTINNFNKKKVSIVTKPLKFTKFDNFPNFNNLKINPISNINQEKNLKTNFNNFNQPLNKFKNTKNIYKKDSTFTPYKYKSLNNFDKKRITTKKKLRNSLDKLKEMEKSLSQTLPSYSQIPKISNKNKFSFVKSYRFIENNVLNLIKAVEKGPVIVAHYVSKEFKFYKKGIYTGEGCENIKKVNHASLIVGYNLNTEVPYFLLKNAWGSGWGENGFYKIKIGPLTKSNKGICLLASTEFNLVPELY